MSTHVAGASARVSTLRTVSRPPSVTRYDTPSSVAEPLPRGTARATVSIVSGLDAGRIVPIEGASVVIGRGEEADLRVEDAAVSRVHARITRTGERSFQIEDLGSTNGTFMGSRRITVEPLVSGDHVQLGPGILLRFALTEPADERLQADLYESSIRDPLTKAYNRRYLLSRLEVEVAHARRHGTPFAALMLDIDHFKDCNDRFGHFVGDRVLGLVTTQAVRMLRAGDLLARFGGDEFIVLCRDTDATQAMALADRLRVAVSNMRLSAGGEQVAITLSIGVASLAEVGPDRPAEALVDRVDARLGVAKRLGRNRVCAANH